MSRRTEMAKEIAELREGMTEDYPGHFDEIRRGIVIRTAVEAADNIIMHGTEGSVEETDWLTQEVAHKFAEKVSMALAAKLRQHDLEKRLKS